MKKKTTLYYFSGTGNSLKAAGDLKAKLGNAELVPMAAEIKKGHIKADSEAVGFIFPVHTLGPVSIVDEFIAKIDLDQVKYLFAVAVKSSNHGVVFKEIDRVLKKKGRVLNAGFGLRMGANTNLFSNIPGTRDILSPEEQKTAFEEAGQTITLIAQTVNNREDNSKEGPRGIKSFLLSAIRKSFVKKSSTFDKHFSLSEKCTGCKTCESVCPAQNIVIKNTQGRWQHSCRACLACYNHCPQEAIKHSFAKKTGMDKKYTNPHITKSELAAQKG